MPILRNVKCRWASVIEPNTKYDDAWEIEALLDKEQAAFFADLGCNVKQDDDGTNFFRFKRKCEGKLKEGGTFKKDAPKVVDAGKKPFTQLVGNGSVVNISYKLNTNVMMGVTHVTGDLCAVQVLEHVPYGDDGFDDEGETTTIEEVVKSEVEDSADADLDDVDGDDPF